MAFDWRPHHTPSPSPSPAPQEMSDEQSAQSSHQQRVRRRKRLAKACDNCHKAKRRCDGNVPCSNCHHASKTCTYTDALGRPVPAPGQMRLEGPSSQPKVIPPPAGTSGKYYFTSFPPQSYEQSTSQPLPELPALGLPSSSSLAPPSDNAPSRQHTRQTDERYNPMRRPHPSPREQVQAETPESVLTLQHARKIPLDNALTRELVNLFFTHCQPARMIFHKPTIETALAHNTIPGYLLFAICALAAPLSKQPRIQCTPARYGGTPFAQEALSLMFDGAGRLLCEANLSTAQALCLLQIHDMVASWPAASWNKKHSSLALLIVEKLGVNQPEYRYSTPLPSTEHIRASIDRECVRRVYWLTYIMDIYASIFFKAEPTWLEREPHCPLPQDETTFELATQPATPEFLHLPGSQTTSASETGHLVRITAIWGEIELALDAVDDPDLKLEVSANKFSALQEKYEAWEKSLPQHLAFTEENLEYQKSMLATSSNNGAWSWACMHVYRAASVLALHYAYKTLEPGAMSGYPSWPVQVIHTIHQMMGDRAMNSTLLGGILWILMKYCGRNDDEIHKLNEANNNLWGVYMPRLVADKRSAHRHMSPPSSHSSPAQTPEPRSGPRLKHPSMSGPSASASYASSTTSHPTPSMSSNLPPLVPSGRMPNLIAPSSANIPPPFLASHYPQAPIVPANAIPPEFMAGPPPPQIAQWMHSRRPSTAPWQEPSSSNAQAHHNHDNNALPSLKSSGLLEFAGKGTADPSSIPPPPPLAGPSVDTSMRQSTSDAKDGQTLPTPVRSAPVGMPWLADESMSR
ncbi:fungal-specific transcription factor domain-containing protein [Schizophyllum commune]